jgi:hypothetical protein
MDMYFSLGCPLSCTPFSLLWTPSLLCRALGTDRLAVCVVLCARLAMNSVMSCGISLYWLKHPWMDATTRVASTSTH